MMIKFTKFFLIMFFGLFGTLNAQDNIIQISGKISDKDTKESLLGVSILVKGTVAGTITDTKGEFLLRTKLKFPFVLQFSSVGYKTTEIEVNSLSNKLNVELATQSILGQEIVVTASRVEESILKSPVAIDKLDIRAIKQSAGGSFYDALENVKGVQMITSSLTFKVPNTRGFNIPNNFRFMQLVDGVDMQAATLGVPLGNAIGPTELDIESVEITPGAASALYGMNAINGLSNLQTKSPFRYQGLSLYQRTGVNHVDGKDHDPSVLTETALRYAKAFKNQSGIEVFAFKVNASYLQGIDWRSNTRLDQNTNDKKTANPAFSVLNGTNNLAFDGWNKYGDDALAGSNTVSLTGLTIDGKPNQTLTVARTGYWETDLVNPKIDNLKLDASLHYRLGSNTEISYSYRYGKMDGVFQRGNKIQLNNVVVQNHKLEIKGVDFSVRAYVSRENTGDSYNVKPLADNLDLYSGGSNSAWGTKFKTELQNQLNNGIDLATAGTLARQAADKGRVEPGTQAFEDLKNTIIKINNWDIKSSTIPNAPVTGGAALIQKSSIYHIEGQWDLSKKIMVAERRPFDLLIGADARVYEIIPDGNNFVDFSRPIAERNFPLEDGTFGKNIYYKKVGGFAQATKTFFEDKLKLFASVRGDYNPEYDPKFTPRLAAVYTANKIHNFRFTFQEGYRYPAIFEALSYVNNGRVKRVGSLPYINDGLGYRDNSYTQTSVANFNAVVKAAGNTDAAALANKGLLQAGDLPIARPEKITSFEVGYKSILFDNKLVIDFDVYSNIYDGFLGQVQVFVPIGANIGTDAAVLAMIDRNRDATIATSSTSASKGQERYRVYTNAKNSYHSYGSSLGLTYNFYKKYTVSGNVNYNNIATNAQADIFVTGFNTPKWTTNLSIGNREIIKNVGFNVTYRWQEAFLWESPLVTGNINAINNVDAQVNLRIPAYKATIKLGGTDIFNSRYLQYAGGPTIGGLYYLALTIEGI